MPKVQSGEGLAKQRNGAERNDRRSAPEPAQAIGSCHRSPRGAKGVGNRKGDSGAGGTE